MPPIIDLAQPVITSVDARAFSMRDRRKKQRADVPAMYSAVVVRVLNKRMNPIDGHVLNVSASGLMVELDNIVAAGTPVTVEFSVPGLGRERHNEWPVFVATAEVVRAAEEEEDDFPQGPYRTALRFIRIPTIAQAQIARFIAATTAGPRSHS